MTRRFNSSRQGFHRNRPTLELHPPAATGRDSHQHHGDQLAYCCRYPVDGSTISRVWSRVNATQ